MLNWKQDPKLKQILLNPKRPCQKQKRLAINRLSTGYEDLKKKKHIYL
jgi:hypothetical protein